MRRDEAPPEPDSSAAQTIVEGPGPPVHRVAVATERTRTPASTAGRSVSATTAHTALRAEEAARTSAFGLVVAVLCAIGLLNQLFIRGVPWLWTGMTVALVVLFAVSIVTWLVARDPARYTPWVFRSFAIAALTTSIVFELYLGVFSPVPVIIALGLSFFGLGDDRGWAIFLCASAVVAYAAITAAITFGLFDDPGLFVAIGTRLPARVTMLIMVVCVQAATIWQARVSRGAMYDAVERSNEAVRLARQREAQLEEANQNLDHVLRAGAGLGGRHTGARVGSYELGDVLGRGAMGEVYAATHVVSGEPAAVKLLHLDVLEDADLVRRFLREAEVTARLSAPNVVRVLEAGALPSGAPFLAMELLTGHDLGWHLRQRQSLSPADVAVLATEVATGLEAAHAAGIVHRDLKPQNLLRYEPPPPGTPRWKILDFGVSKLRGSSGTLTAGAIVGTPGYMAPEQARGLEADHRCDVFALGAVCYRALTGRPPFHGPDTPQVLFDIVYKAPVRPRELAPAVTNDVERVLAIALAKRADDRFDSATELASAFTAACRNELSAELRQRADALLAALPWGKSVRG